MGAPLPQPSRTSRLQLGRSGRQGGEEHAFHQVQLFGFAPEVVIRRSYALSCARRRADRDKRERRPLSLGARNAVAYGRFRKAGELRRSPRTMADFERRLGCPALARRRTGRGDRCIARGAPRRREPTALAVTAYRGSAAPALILLRLPHVWNSRTGPRNHLNPRTRRRTHRGTIGEERRWVGHRFSRDFALI